MPPRLRVVVPVPEDSHGQQQQQDSTWSWMRSKGWAKGSSKSLCQDSSEASFCSAASQQQEEVCLSPLSQYFCNVEQPPDIYAIMTLDGYCTLEELVKPMQHMADLHDRFRRRVVFRFGAWKAEYLQDFDVRRMMREVTLDGPDAQLAFDDYMGKLMTSEPLGTDGLPPWDVLCIHYTCNPARTDVLMRASHIIGDGQLFMKLIKQIMDPLDATAEADLAATVASCSSSSSDKGAGSATAADAVRRAADSSSGSSDLGSCQSGSLAGGIRSEGSSSSSSLESSSTSSDAEEGEQQQQQHQHGCSEGAEARQEHKQQHKQQHRRHRVHSVGGFFKMMWKFITMCWHGYTALIFTSWLPFWFADRESAVKASPRDCVGPRKWSSITLSLPEFHRTARLVHSSINTLAVSCLAGGIRRYLLRMGQQPRNRVRLCSMVDTRSMPGLLTGTDGNSNNFSFIGVPLFTGDCGPLARLGRVGWSLSWIRHSLAVPLAIRMPSIIQFLFRDPAWSSWATLHCLPFKATIGFSNMRGPTGKWALSGHPVVRIHNGVQPNAFGCFMSLFSYCDSLTFTHTCYASKTVRPEVLLSCIKEEYDALRKAAAVGTLSRQCGHGSGSEPGTPGSDKIKAA